MYRLLFRLLLTRLPAEAVHHVAFACLRAFAALPGVAALLRWALRPHARLRRRVWDLDLSSPVALAAGFDKDARGPEALGLLGFGAIEVGTVTGEAQPGNPQPRLFRLPADRALINRMGFNNDGARAAGQRLAGGLATRRVVTGVNIGKTKAVPEAYATEDYVKSARALARVADYLVVNVSSPNTPGLRNLQAVEALRPLLVAVRAVLDEERPERRVPLVVKIAPDLADDDVDRVADLALELNLDGIAATNTTIARKGLLTDPGTIERIGAGGVSGAPLKTRALQVLRRLHARTGGKIVLIAAGGIETADDVVERLQAGASFVQVYTGFVYGGPLFVWRLNRELGRRLHPSGAAAPSAA